MRKMPFNVQLKAALKPKIIVTQWLRCHLYELRATWVNTDAGWQQRYCWFNDKDRRVSSEYKSLSMAQTHFGIFDPTETFRTTDDNYEMEVSK